MYSSNSLLPVVYKDVSENCTETLSPRTNGEDNHKSKEQTSKLGSKLKNLKKGTGNVVISISLCLLTVFSLALFAFFNAGSFINGEKILGYIASDFLGIDPSKDNRNFYEILMSGSFGDYNHPPSKEPDSPQNQPSNNNETPNNTLPPENTTDNDTPNNFNGQEIPTGHFAIIKTDLSSDSVTISNQTDYEINIEELKNAPNKNDGYIFGINDDMTVDPMVLIIHTHGTEAYSEEGSISYSDDTNVPRSEDITKNVVSVGAEMAKTLNESGVPTIHCEIMHDKESYKNSYSRAAETIKEYLKKYPSIKYVLDVHRDSVIGENKIKYKPLTEINGQQTAQVMLVMGSDYSAPEHTDWKENLTLAVKFTEQLNSKYEAFTRPMSLRASSYNQEYTKGSMLLEIGSCGNTLSEAKAAAVVVAKELSIIIKNGW